jgi:hypothetical protein
MSHIVHGLIRKAPLIKQLATSTMFVLEISEMVKDFKTGEKTYTNYKAMLFAKSDQAAAYYTKATAEGSFVVLHSEKLKVETFEAQSGKTYITLMMDNARLEGAHFDDAHAPAQAQQMQQRPAPQQQAPASYGTPPPNHQPAAPQYAHPPAQPQYAQPQNNFEDDIPFN